MLSEEATNMEAEGVRVSAPILPGHAGPGTVMPASCWWIGPGGRVGVRRVGLGGESRDRCRVLDRSDPRFVSGRRGDRVAAGAPPRSWRSATDWPAREAGDRAGPARRDIPNLPRRCPRSATLEMRRLASSSAVFGHSVLGRL